MKFFETADLRLALSYARTQLHELNTAADVEEVTPIVVQQALEAQHKGANVIVIYGFCDVGIQESKAAGISIPILGVGRAAIQASYSICSKAFTVIPAQIAHNSFINDFVIQEGLSDKFKLAQHAVGLNPAQLRVNPQKTLSLLIEAAHAEIMERNIDTFTFGCASFIGFAQLLESKLRTLHGPDIHVVDPADAVFKEAKRLIANA